MQFLRIKFDDLNFELSVLYSKRLYNTKIGSAL